MRNSQDSVRSELKIDELSAFALAQNHQAKIAGGRQHGPDVGVHGLEQVGELAAFAVAGIVGERSNEAERQNAAPEHPKRTRRVQNRVRLEQLADGMK